MIYLDENQADLGYVIYGLRIKGSGEFRYIGLTTTSLRQRCKEHNVMTRRSHHYAVYKWLRAHMSDEVEIVVLCLCITDNAFLCAVEAKLISHYRAAGHRLLNSTAGGEGLLNPSSETRLKQSLAASKRVGKRNSRYGYKYTPEQRQQKSLQQKGKINVGVHTRWHVNRDLVDPKCSFCIVLTSQVG